MSTVKDREDREYVLTDVLAEGGEGRVMRTDHPRVLVKLRLAGGEERLDEVVRADLEGLAVIRPAALLAPPAMGYVMHLVQDAEPLEALMRPGGLAAADTGEWYAATGGARRRLRALGGLASAMAGLHARGLCMADVSPRNVLIPLSAAEQPAWLIDLDNLHAPDALKVSKHTLPYVAPEVHRGERPCSMRSDVYCLALLSLEILTLWFPLFGDEIRAGDPELEEPALAGHVPWIHDREDPSNAAARAAPADEFLGRELEWLARRALEEGRLEPTARPTAAAWAGVLHREADRSIRCEQSSCSAWCAGHWRQCMSCGSKLPEPAALLRVVGSDPQWPEQLAVPHGESRLVRRRFTTGRVGPHDSCPEIEVSSRAGGLRLEQIGTGEVAYEVQPGGRLLPGVPLTITPRTESRLLMDGGRVAEVVWR